MRTMLLLVAALMAAAPAWARWTKFSESSGGDVFYVDKGSVSPHGNRRRVWTLIDYAAPTRHGDLSNKRYQELDCQDRRVRLLQDHFYTGPMASGSNSDSFYTVGAWQNAPADTVLGTLVNVACSP